jgi:hypothetical protein
MPTRISTTSRCTERQLGLVQPTSMMQVDGLQCPLLVQYRTNFAAQRNDAKCHKRTHAPQQSASLFDHLVGERENAGRKIETERLGSLEIDNELQLCRLLDGKVGRLGTL